MDLLSLIANVVAVCGAASNATKYLRQFTSLTRVPEQLLQLLNDVSPLPLFLFPCHIMLIQIEAIGSHCGSIRS